MKIYNKFKSIVLFLVVASVLCSCYGSKNTAKEFTNYYNNKQEVFYNNHPIALMLIEPENLFMDNLKTEYAYVNLDTIGWTQIQKDSLLYFQTSYLQYISADSISKEYMFMLSTMLKSYGFMVYDEDQITEFLKDSNDGYIINIAQLQLEEFENMKYEFFKNSFYESVQPILLNSVAINSWIEITKKDDTNKKNVEIYYSTQTVKDRYTGEFVFYNDDYVYQFDEFIELEVSHIFELAEFSAIKISKCIYNELLYDFIVEQYPYGYLRWFYNFDSHKVVKKETAVFLDVN